MRWPVRDRVRRYGVEGEACMRSALPQLTSCLKSFVARSRADAIVSSVSLKRRTFLNPTYVLGNGMGESVFNGTCAIYPTTTHDLDAVVVTDEDDAPWLSVI